jgi:hypothetical protein
MSYSRDSAIRVVLATAGFISILFAPWWVPFACMVLLSLRFRAWEVLLIGLCMDLIWLPTGTFFSPIPLFLLGALIMVWALEPLRSRFLL